MEPKDILTGYQVSELLQIDYHTLLRHARNGRIPSFRIGEKVRFRRQDLEAWIAEQQKSKPKEEVTA